MDVSLYVWETHGALKNVPHWAPGYMTMSSPWTVELRIRSGFQRGLDKLVGIKALDRDLDLIFCLSLASFNPDSWALSSPFTRISNSGVSYLLQLLMEGTN